MATYKLDLNDKNYSTKVLSYYLWGQDTQPTSEEMANAKWIGRTEKITLEVDTDQFVKKYRNLFNAKDFRLTKVFFSGKTSKENELNIANISAGVTINANGEYELTQEQFAALFYVDDEKNFDAAENPSASASLYTRGLGDDDFAKRAFVFGSVNIGIDKSVRYILDKDLNPLRIENFDIVVNGKRTEGDKTVDGDNFDLKGGTGSELANKILTQVANPSDIGKTVKLDFGDGAVIKTPVLTESDYDDLSPVPEGDDDWELIDKYEINTLFYEEYKRMLGDGVMNYSGEEDKIVIFGSDGNDTISGTQAIKFNLANDVDVSGYGKKSDLAKFYEWNHFREDGKLDRGMIYVGGKGNDTISGTDKNDILKGGEGNDTYYAGDNDIIIDSDGQGLVYFANKQLAGGIDYLGDGTYTNGTLSYTLNGTTLTITDSVTKYTTTIKEVKPFETINGEDRILDVGLGIHLESTANQTTAPIGATYVTVRTTDEWHQYQIPIYDTDQEGNRYIDHYIDNPAYIVHWAGASFSADSDSNTISLKPDGGTIYALGGDDIFQIDSNTANSSSFTLYGGDGNDTFKTYNDGNVIYGGSGVDTILVGNNATIETGSGADKVTAGNYAIVTNQSGRDTITTGNYANITGSMWAESIRVGSDSLHAEQINQRREVA